jgi:outer membrane protein assembly factor BamB
VVASPDEEVLYVATLGGSLVALSRARAGAPLWSVPLGGRAYGAPCVADDGTIFVGSDARRFVAVSPDGHVKWKLETDGEADTGCLLARDGTVIFTAGATVLSVRARGDVAWRFAAKGKIFAAPAQSDAGLVTFGAQDHRAYGVSPGGALVWSTDLGADVDGAPAIGDDGGIFVGTDAGDVVRLDDEGTVVWRARVDGYVRGSLSIARDGDVLAGVYGPTPRVVRVTPQGEVRGAFHVPGTGAREFGVHGGPLEDAAGTLYFGAQDDVVYAISGVTGDPLWSSRVGDDVDAPATVLSDGTLIVASDDARVYAFPP